MSALHVIEISISRKENVIIFIVVNNAIKLKNFHTLI